MGNTVCHNCKRPWKSADPNCHTFCEDYIIEHAFHEAALEERNRKRAVDLELYRQTSEAARRATHKGRQRRGKFDQ